MKRKLYLVLGYILSLVSIFITVYYLALEVNKYVNVDIKSKMIFISISVIVFYLSTLLLDKSNYIKINIKKMNLYFHFSLYLFIIIFMMLFDINFGRGIEKINNNYSFYINNCVNLIPFKTILSYLTSGNFTTKTIIINIVGNLLAFSPLALFIPLSNKKSNNIKSIIIKTTCIVLILEITQLITLSGSLDIDDLILNLSGVVLMYLVIKKLKIDVFMKKYVYNI